MATLKANESIRRLCRICVGDKRWYPTSVSRLDELLKTRIYRSTHIPNGYAIRKNLCYGIQYLQYVVASLEQLSLSEVLLTQSYKTFIVTGIGIIEGILFYLVKEGNHQRTSEWEVIKESTSGPFTEGVATLRVDTTILRKRAAPVDDDLPFERILRITEQKQLFGTKSQFYAQAHHLRKLRNKVHLFVTANELDTDWNAFAFKDFELMKSLLLEIFTSGLFVPSPEQKKYFSFLHAWSILGVPLA